MRRTLTMLLALFCCMVSAPRAQAQGFLVPSGSIGEGKDTQDLAAMPTIDFYPPTGRADDLSIRLMGAEEFARSKWPKGGDDYREFLERARTRWIQGYLMEIDREDTVGSAGQSTGTFVHAPVDLPWVFYPNFVQNHKIKKLEISVNNGDDWYPGLVLSTGWAATVPRDVIKPGRIYNIMAKITDRSGRSYIRIFVIRISRSRNANQWVNFQVMFQRMPDDVDTRDFTLEDWRNWTRGLLDPVASPIASPAGPEVSVHEDEGEPVTDEDEDHKRSRDTKQVSLPPARSSKPAKARMEVKEPASIRIELRQSNGSLADEGLELWLCGYDSDGVQRIKRQVVVPEDGVLSVADVQAGLYYTLLLPPHYARDWKLPDTGERAFKVTISNRSYMIQTWRLEENQELTLALQRSAR